MKLYKILFSFTLLLGLQLVYACSGKSDTQDTTIKTGAEQTSLYFSLLKDKNVALVANHTTVIGRTHLADSLIKSGVQLTRIFTPEHGFRGTSGAGDAIEDTLDMKTGIPVTSLYGSRVKPVPDDLKGIDIMIYDIQDVGVRFYTYISTLHYVMEACAENKIPMIVLDRPDPLGFYVDGPVLDTAYRSFVGMHKIPVVYGMTAGELAQMINGEGWLKGNVRCKLTVIPCDAYNHDSIYALPVNPSPNLNSMEGIYLYPSVCFFEGTVMSLGRGTEYPFRVIGHPEYPLKEFSFVPRKNTANKNPVYLDQTCYGIDLRSLTNKELIQFRQINIQWLIDVYRSMNRDGKFFTNYIDKLAGNGKLRKQIIEGLTEEQIRRGWEDDLRIFREQRKKYLLYNDFTH